ncbi:hypothetical protein BU26DRAFT_151643 [Trematosphaeria pertusa]|uniref:RING-type domain-containing protein n=1 Tax=Trematosphaeria pertusa TaxID=390896 RepID=A0A6A6IXP2_9PLEO|nr:uncharacterized protein BU26DRAFT_151643 [Trematosphaeria pertusa]KAF2255164.1 hypothetical protein BU26DRAFT_151643 [Trematosphaeria pertusa]
MANLPSSHLVVFTTPLPLRCLQADSRDCPICHEAYGDYRPGMLDLGEAQAEWAVRVDLTAEPDRSRRCCGHIFGRRCLEKHLRRPEPWHNKCPICRLTWFPSDNLSNHRAATPASARPPTTAVASTRVSARRILESRHRRQGNGRRSSSRGPSTRPQRPSSFIQQLLEHFEVRDGSDEVKASADEVEQRLRGLYGSIEEPNDAGS